ncbi:ubiquinone biosynthesis hydrox [Acaromyces ingoldii]|uniref:Ubiquinone biosynthesis hydrox n=1 Tax=Acaromyces ingoldii TaxID=215250 RepID=A0A316YIN7_9BASI|nr:ubiquinone biosynthesis hydrox [Acaromyces ingoldii]PWN87575.1 ubiquinone biosynthesis hydrox [Acaromyces ingoldii]
MSLTRSAAVGIRSSRRASLHLHATARRLGVTEGSRVTQVAAPRRMAVSRGFATATPNLTSTPTTLVDGQQDESDVVVIGGGVVGLSLACSLISSPSFATSGNSLTLIEASDLDRFRTWAETRQKGGAADEARPHDGIDWENRVIYLTEENRAWLDDIGVSQYLETQRLGPVHSMHVTDGLTGAALDFDIEDGGRTAAEARLGTMVEISNLQQAMIRRLDDAAKQGLPVSVLQGTKVARIDASTGASSKDPWPLLTLDEGSQQRRLRARLLVGADGHNSPVRSYAGIGAFGWDYDRKGLVGTLRHRRPGMAEEQPRTAFQRFLPTGTIAWLPLSEQTSSMVWTLPPKMAEALTKMHRECAATATRQTLPLAHLITAAFRLPYAALNDVLCRIVAQCESPSASPGQDWSWVVGALEEHLIAAAASSSSTPHAPAGLTMTESEVPPPVASVDAKSVASFPLRLSHADAYLGSSLANEADASTSGAAAFTPSFFLDKALALANLKSGGQKGAPDADARPRTALVGDAAHTIHPLAGQGLNLGLADARCLSQALERASERGADLGAHASLSAYPRGRYLANQAVLSAVDHLHWLFVVPPPLSFTGEGHGQAGNGVVQESVARAAIWARSTGFEVLNELGSVKRAITSFAGSTTSSRRR